MGTQAESVISMYLSGFLKKPMVGKGVFSTRKETRARLGRIEVGGEENATVLNVRGGLFRRRSEGKFGLNPPPTLSFTRGKVQLTEMHLIFLRIHWRIFPSSRLKTKLQLKSL